MLKPNSSAVKIMEEAIPLTKCLAKSIKVTSDRVVPGRGIIEHCLIVGFVARELLNRFPHEIRSALFPIGAELVAALHDIGKASPTFQKKIYSSITDQDTIVLNSLAGINETIEINWGGHAGVSQATAKYFKLGKYIPEIIGQHHGASPELGSLVATDACFGGSSWQLRRKELIDLITGELGVSLPVLANESCVRILSGLTTVADWIGSGSFFESPEDEWSNNVSKAVDNAGFVPPKLTEKLSFEGIFGFQAKESQLQFISACRGPGVYVLEAPMGLGKTEAALYAAYRLMLEKKATGLYFALPTQLTSDRIHERVNGFLQKILAEDCIHRRALLLHGNAWLKQSEMGEDGLPGRSWFSAKKRGILAPFAVGTIDQALMAAMNVRHGFVRTFGLAGKVVILDEVHSYDFYTGTILDRLVEMLRQLHCTVVILSATLTSQRRQALLKTKTRRDEYPLITACPVQKELSEIPCEMISDQEVLVAHFDRDNEVIELVLEKAQQGEQVLWIENTVAEAQESFRLFAARAAECNIECGLLHSRFTRMDRDRIENKWVSLFGKDGAGVRSATGRILVGTQVLEQSLDIDADLLVSRICPTDMLIQRIGRLWRHENTRRPVGAKRQAILLTPPSQKYIDNPKSSLKGTSFVYSPYVLGRTLEVWEPLEKIVIPRQIRELIGATYAEREEQGNMLRYRQDLKQKKDILERMALIGLSAGIKTLPESKANTRYGEQNTCDVLLIKGIELDHKTGERKLEFLGGEQLSFSGKRGKIDFATRREFSIKLMENMVSVVDYRAPHPAVSKKMGWLKDFVYVGGQDGDESLRVGVVKPDGKIAEVDGGEANEDYSLYYCPTLGYQADKKN